MPDFRKLQKTDYSNAGIGYEVDNWDDVLPPEADEEDPRWERWLDGQRYIVELGVHVTPKLRSFTYQLREHGRLANKRVEWGVHGNLVGFQFFPLAALRLENARLPELTSGSSE